MSDDFLTNPRFNSSRDQWKKVKARARELRQDATYAEDVLWQALRNRQLDGLKFRRQYTIKHFIVDFACVDRKLVIEVDGSIHELTQDRDVERQAIIENEGFKVLRFSNTQILESINEVLQVIREALRPD